jgi:Tfp pilus assembly protein PilX
MNYQRGVTLIITFFVMTIMLAIVVSISLLLYNQVKLIANIGNSVSSFYAAESGLEKTLYYDRKQIPTHAARGFCNICNTCDSADCKNCTKIPLDGVDNSGCDVNTCNNCEVTYTTMFDDKTYQVDAKVTPDESNPNFSIFNISAWGYYVDSVRAVNITLIK